ncbi:MAG: phage portal protein, partial [Alphaproteobacteria bacterium]
MLARLTRIFRPKRRRSLEAAGGGRRWDGFQPLTAPSQSILAARGPVLQRVRAAYVNHPVAHRVVEHLAASLVGGSSWQAQSQHPDPDTRRALNSEFEDLVAGLMLPLARGLARDGEALVRLETSAAGVLSARLLAPEQLDASLHRELPDGGRITAGIEFDDDGEIVAYHILPHAPDQPGPVGEAVRLPAGEVLHVFDPLFPGQVRGISPLSPVLLKLADYDAASDAMLMALKIQSLMTGFISDPEGGTAGFSGTAEGDALNLSLEPGAMRVLPPGAEVEFSRPGDGLAQAADFLKCQLREIAAGAGLMFEHLSGDLSGTNYSSARFGLLEFRRRIEMLQRSLIERQFLRPLWQRWIAHKALAGEIPLDELA